MHSAMMNVRIPRMPRGTIGTAPLGDNRGPRGVLTAPQKESFAAIRKLR
jgi:hypothetical protein